MRTGALVAMLCALAGCKYGFEERTGGPGSDGGIDAPADAPSCDPPARGDFATWTVPNFMAGLPHQASYTPSTDGMVVKDNITGLFWQRATAPTKMTQPDAQAYCEGLTLGGTCDWRLPERIELISIADYTKPSPTIDATMFPDTVGDVYWSATGVLGSPLQAWYLSFQNGVIERTTRSSDYSVRCVRAGALPPSAHYAADASTVLDNGTGLTWERVVDLGYYNHAQAMARCSALTLAGGGWRSPSINELESLVDVTRESPAIQTITFPSTPSSLFWSRDVQVVDSSQGWTVDFDQGTVARSLTTTLPVRCVR